MQVDVPRPKDWGGEGPSLSSAEMRAEVLKARLFRQRDIRLCRYHWNSELSGAALRRYASLGREGTLMLHTILESLGLSMRAHDRIIKLARTIADLEGSVDIVSAHLAEAVQYRNLDRQIMTED